MSNNNLARELVENRIFLNQSQSRKLQFLLLSQLSPFLVLWEQIWIVTKSFSGF